MTAWRHRSRPLLAVLLLHAALIGALWSQRAPLSRGPAGAPPVQAPLWLRSMPTTTPLHAPMPAEVKRTQRQVLPRMAQPVRQPQAITVPATVDNGGPTPAAAATDTRADASTMADTGPPRPLNLALPPRRAASEPPTALTRDDPRVQERLSYEARMARAFGTDTRLHESVLPDGTRRFQRGTSCVQARSARAEELDPFNKSSRPLPRGISPC